MIISGFTIIRNAIINDYPIVEAIRSILPVVDELVVSVGRSDDDTEGLIRGIDSPKIRIVHSEWDMSLRKGGAVLAVETDKAFQQIRPDADWAFYIQADEVVHEQYHQAIRRACEQHLNNHEVDGLLFDYTHFYGTYDYIGDSRRWYRREVRVVRNDKAIRSYRDAQGFRRDGEKLRVKSANAGVYHYGWVKSPQQMLTKIKNLDSLWDEGRAPEQHPLAAAEAFNFDDYDSLQRFRGSHPAVMQPRVQRQNWQVDIDVTRKRFKLKNRVLHWVEKLTGKRLFEYRNYRLV